MSETRMRYFFIERAEAVKPISKISGSDAKHIKNVMRLKSGDIIGLFDGEGLEYKARIASLSPGSVNVSVLESFSSTAESPVHITVAQAYLKDRKMDDLIRQVTALGVTRWAPFFAAHSVPRLDEKRLSERVKRWKKIAKEALKQCKRGRMMEINKPGSFEDAINLGQGHDLKIAFWERESAPINAELHPRSGGNFQKIFLLLGPEGGFTSQEIAKARAGGFITAALGPRILRAETATLAACALIQYLFGDMGQKNLDKDSVL
ncbi:MAG: 16S rRNA (uracil(1498)-N(3))-methyltransferase [Deltaproteobacteria bacterium]|nr:16S rRNA (uracil(1498)-N(3))-methyltransferase [Deltaproteobacteria bacterium]